jgi:glycosyltransferase involved in cell wall biosynthesis
MIFISITSFLVLGLVGGGSVLAALFPLKKPENTFTGEVVFEVLIPAHNEEKKIGITLAALEKEFRGLSFRPRIRIALDACHDQTEKVIQEWSSRLSVVISKVSFQSKWRTLQSLVSQSQSEWVIFLDSGISFEEGLLPAWVSAMKDRNHLLVAPAYRLEGGSLLSRVFWIFENTVKKIENRAGGPISVHGAAVAYQKAVIQTVFQHLNLDQESDFKNDDVILPLASRVLFKKMSSLYLADHCVFDQAKVDATDFQTQVNQRKRMMIGNLQWIRWMKTDSRIRKPARIHLLALRRKLRPFWVYVLLVFSASFIAVNGWVSLGLLLPMVWFRAAAIASFQAPAAWWNHLDQKKSAWK